MAIRALPLVLLSAIFLAGLSGSFAQPPPAAPKPLDALDNVTSGYNDTAYLFDFVFPPKGSNVSIGDTAAAFVGTGLASRLFTIPPCFSGTVPHFHPNSAEYFIGVQGKPQVYVYNGGRLIVNVLDPTKAGIKTHVAPRSNLHWFVNDDCEQASILSVLNPGPGGPGFFGYFNPPDVFAANTPTAADVAALIASRVPTATGTPAAFALTTKCAKRCARKHRHGKYGKYYGDDDDK
jgi:hypothetical protein